MNYWDLLDDRILGVPSLRQQLDFLKRNAPPRPPQGGTAVVRSPLRAIEVTTHSDREQSFVVVSPIT